MMHHDGCHYAGYGCADFKYAKGLIPSVVMPIVIILNVVTPAWLPFVLSKQLFLIKDVLFVSAA
jgi:hypothetical protein